MVKHKTISWGVIFDLDGVIVDTYPWHREAISEFCKRHKSEIIEFDEDKLRKSIFGAPNRTWIPLIFQTPLTDARIDELSEEKEKIFRSCIQRPIEPLKGLKELLVQLNSHGIPIAVASSAPPKNISLLLKETNLAQYFRFVLDDTTVSKGKPAPEIYLKAANMIGIPSNHCIVFEDSLTGIEAGIKAGCIVVGVSTIHSSKDFPPDLPLVKNDFDEISIGTLISLIEKNTDTN